MKGEGGVCWCSCWLVFLPLDMISWCVWLNADVVLDVGKEFGDEDTDEE